MAQGSARGNWFMTRSSGSATTNFDAQVLDRRPRNESIYYATWTYSRNGCATCSAQGTVYKESARWNGDYWRDIDVSAGGMNGGYSQARAEVKTCEDQRFSPDDCSSKWSSSWVSY
ncbi:hypothetical protein ACGFJ4_16360 [Micromonospora chalcea]|uniref:hypothetical protein n=1 Tax=Micromonospora chalcea TaxID=1874 RepID=UPI003713F484